MSKNKYKIAHLYSTGSRVDISKSKFFVMTNCSLYILQTLIKYRMVHYAVFHQSLFSLLKLFRMKRVDE